MKDFLLHRVALMHSMSHGRVNSDIEGLTNGTI